MSNLNRLPTTIEMTWRASDGDEHLVTLPGNARIGVFPTDLPSDSVAVSLRPFAADGVAGAPARVPAAR